ncbi:MAG TPA: tetratricopeptide repeat protein [bacterium]|jgi:predicted regulator of Ras-like GTPase activity (Roadblock/LC7/MglB family)|nr:tetratricopeptide repeat protein [bacterium]
MVKEDGEIKELGKKLAQNPDSMVFVQLADAYRRAGDLESSVETCLRGLERHPNYATARVILGRNYLDLGKLDEAGAEFLSIEKSDPENILAHRMLGQIALQKGHFAEAIARQQRVLALDPDDGTAQELLQQALMQAKQSESAAKGAPAAPKAPAPAPSAPAAPAAPKAAATDEQSQALKVADIYIKKHDFEKAIEVVREILLVSPDHALSQQKLKEIVALKVAASGVDKQLEENRKAEEEARRKAEEEARRKAEEAARAKAEEEVRRKAEEEAARAKAEEEARRKAEEAARAKAEEEARRKAEEEAGRAKAEEEARRKAEEAARAKAEEEAHRKAEEEILRKAEEETRRKAAEEAARGKAEEESRRKAEEEAARGKAEEEARSKASKAPDVRGRGLEKFTQDDILSVIAGSAEDLIGNDGQAAPVKKSGASPEALGVIEAFLKAQAIEASLLLDAKGAMVDCRMPGDPAALAQTAAAVFQGTERAALSVGLGGLKQVMIMGPDNRQILFLKLGAGVLVVLTGRETNVGLLRVAVQDLMKRA